MKIFRILIVSLCFAATFSLANCSGGHSHSTDQTEMGKERTSAYICPMYCAGSGSEEPGKCPACGMDYVVNENKDAGDAHDDGHNHDHGGHDHDGHDHGDHGHTH